MFDCYDATVPALALLDGLEHLPHTLYAITGKVLVNILLYYWNDSRMGGKERQCANKFKKIHPKCGVILLVQIFSLPLSPCGRVILMRFFRTQEKEFTRELHC